MKLVASAPLFALALTGCAHTSYLTRSCLTQEQYNQLAQSEPSKVHDKLTGQADKDIRPITGSALELRAWGETLLGTLKVCAQPNSK